MNKSEYLKKFDRSKYKKALELSLDIRKFEIELYWKRATYFWTFIGVAFAGYGLAYKATGDSSQWITLVFSCLGLLFSVAWYFVNSGSKFWQNNWERQVDIFEDEVIGPLYKTIVKDPNKPNILTSGRQYSVSRINQILSFFISLFW